MAPYAVFIGLVLFPKGEGAMTKAQRMREINCGGGGGGEREGEKKRRRKKTRENHEFIILF